MKNKNYNYIRILFLLLALTLNADVYGQRYRFETSALDFTFGTQGKILDSLMINETKSFFVQSDGKILVHTTGIGGDKVSRFNSDGSLDLAFADAGRLNLHAIHDGAFNASKAQADGKLLVFGTRYDFSNGARTDILLKRYNGDGSIDASFGVGGAVVADFSGAEFGYNEIKSVALQSDGKIIVAAVTSSYADRDYKFDIVVARYSPGGVLDTQFGTNGKVIIAPAPRTFFSGACGGNVTYGNDIPHHVRVLPDNKILIAGVLQSLSSRCQNYDYLYASTFALIKLNQDGAFDTSFDGDGFVTDASPIPQPALLWWSAPNVAYKIFPQSGGKFLVEGTIFQPTPENPFRVLGGYFRYNANGSLDTSFGDNGFLNQSNDLGVQSNDKIITINSSAQLPGFCDVAQYNSDGAFETYLNSAIPNAPFSRQIKLDCQELEIQPDDKILIQGTVADENAPRHQMGLMRLLANAPPLKAGR